MKKTFAIFVACAAAALALVSCQKENNAPASVEKTVNFTANAVDTKTAFTTPTGTSYPVVWTENDTKVAVSLNLATPVEATVTPNGSTASFSATFTAPDPAPEKFKFYAVSPSTAYVNSSISSTYKSVSIDFPLNQTPTALSVDEAAQILVAKSAETTSIPESVNLSFSHVTAYGLLSFTNLDLEAGETVETVVLKASAKWTGRWYYYLEDYTGDDPYTAGSIKPNPTYAKDEITINTTSTTGIWFSCAPVDLSGETIDVTVNTSKQKAFKKTITLTGAGVGKFEAGKIAQFTVNMSGVAPTSAAAYTLIFTSETMQTSISNYTSTWHTICNEFDWTVKNFNNNSKGWAFVKCGRKNNASVGEIVTSAAMPKSIKKVVLTIDAILSTEKVNSITLKVATDADFTANLQEIPATVATGSQEIVVTTPTANCYYSLVFDCASHTANGIVTVSKVEYFD